ncbi:MAG: SirB2 family protein [Zoogloeaceae bacterium]|nr:SirB2 family protein [Zoogloeaceae bacterium]
MLYLLLKYIHVTCVGLSFSGFLLRGIWMLSGSTLLEQRLTRVVPHLIDTTLLTSAIGLALLLEQYPIKNDWLTAKVFSLFLYIALGSLALRPGRPRWLKGGAWIGALGTFGYIVSVAVKKNPAGFLAG